MSNENFIPVKGIKDNEIHHKACSEFNFFDVKMTFAKFYFSLQKMFLHINSNVICKDIFEIFIFLP